MLFIVATPIGNPGDLTLRAAEVLASVDLIAAEDTRRCLPLLKRVGATARVISCHDHNEEHCVHAVLRELAAGRKVALVSDAGTPLVSDPGYRLVRAAIDAGVQVVPVPGPCAPVVALSVAGLPSDRFVFEGFLPSRGAARRSRLAALAREPRTLIFFESPRRILDTLRDMADTLDAGRAAVVARELTKIHETVLRGTIAALIERVGSDADQQLGEIVLLVAGTGIDDDADRALDVEAMLRTLLGHLPLKEAVACAVELSGQPRNELYRQALALKSE